MLLLSLSSPPAPPTAATPQPAWGHTWLMAQPSFSLSPVAPVLLLRSLPAKSMRLMREHSSVALARAGSMMICVNLICHATEGGRGGQHSSGGWQQMQRPHQSVTVAANEAATVEGRGSTAAGQRRERRAESRKRRAGQSAERREHEVQSEQGVIDVRRRASGTQAGKCMEGEEMGVDGSAWEEKRMGGDGG